MAIMISIQPQWLEKILNGEKTIEIRKTMPKCKLPCRVYIYCTKTREKKQDKGCVPFDYFTQTPNYMGRIINKYILGANYTEVCLNGKVVAEFTLNEAEEYELELQDDDIYESIGKVYYDIETGEREINIIEDSPDLENTNFIKQSKLSVESLRKYLGKGIQTCYAWHIDNLKIYDKPKELSEFESPKIDLSKEYGGSAVCPAYGRKKITRAPQSWCYVQELGE